VRLRPFLFAPRSKRAKDSLVAAHPFNSRLILIAMEIGFQLCDAAFRGKVDQLKVLVETKNADVNARGYDK
jgi:hypothetical protein